MTHLHTPDNMSAKKKSPDSLMASTPSKRRNCNVLTPAEKVEVINATESGQNKTQVANKFCVAVPRY